MSENDAVSSLITESRTVMPGVVMPFYYEEQADPFHNRGSGCRYRLLFFSKGSGTLSVGTRSIAVITPSVLCLTEDELIERGSGNGFKVSALYFHPSIINSKFTFDILNSADARRTPTEQQDIFCLRPFLDGRADRQPVLLGPNNEIRVRSLLRSVGDIISGEPDRPMWPCLTRSYVIELLNFIQRLSLLNAMEPSIVRGSQPEQTGAQAEDGGASLPASEESAVEVIAYLNAHYPEKITISELTRRFCTNRTTLSREFRRTTGNTIIGYLNRLRIDMAMMLLRDTTLPMGDIMYRVGFNDPAYFGKSFGEITGMSPGDYRRRYSIMI